MYPREDKQNRRQAPQGPIAAPLPNTERATQLLGVVLWLGLLGVILTLGQLS